MALWSNTDTQLSIPKFINRGQIVVVNVEDTVTGRGTYTAIPTLTISAPTDPTGLQATAIATCRVKEFTPGGTATGYAAGDLVTFELDDSADAINPVFRIDSVDEDGAPVTIGVVNYGRLFALSGSLTDSSAITEGDGTGLTMSFTLEIDNIVMTNPGHTYTDDDTITVTFDPASTTVAAAVYRGIQYGAASIIFVDRDECQTEVAIQSGLNSPGWWHYYTYENAQGVTRHKTELEVHLDRTAAEAGDQSDDEIVPEGVISITGPDAAITINEWEADSLSVTAVSNPVASLTYQWQVLNGSSWSNLTNAGFYTGVTTNELAITNPDSSVNGKRYRVKITATGFKTTYSTSSTLTVVPYGEITITGPDAAISIDAGDTGTIATVVESDPEGTLTYQWQIDNEGTWDDLTDTGFYSGTDTDTLTITAPDATIDATTYRLKVSGTGFEDTLSTEAVLTIVT